MDRNNGGDANTWVHFTDPIFVYQGTGVAAITYSATAHNDYLITPPITVTAGVNDRFSFWARSFDPLYPENFNLKVSTTTPTAAAFTTTLANIAPDSNSPTFIQYTFDLTAYLGQTIYIGMHSTTTDMWRISVDEVKSEPIPTCPSPTALTATGITTSSANLAWTAGGSETSWNIQYGVTGFTLGAGTIVNGVTNPYALTGISASTTFQYYVQAACGGTLGNSSWAGPFSFTTACGPITSFPWNESFETVTTPAFPNCWFKENGDWVTVTNASSTYDADARTGTKFLRDSWSATNEFMWTPAFNLVAGTSYDFSFWWAGDTYAGWQGDVYYNTSQISTGATQMGSAFVNLTDITTMAYTFAKRTFVPSVTGTYYFAVRVNCPTANPWYISFDDFKLEPTPACPSPTALTLVSKTATSATFSWTAGGAETEWELEYGLQGFTQGTGTIVPITAASPYTLTGLTYNTQYDAYIRAKCSSSSLSSWSSKVSWFYVDFAQCAATPYPADGATDVPVGSVVFTWVPSSTGEMATSYNMYYGLTPTTVTNLVGNYTVASADINLSGYSTTFYWQIRPVNGAGESTGCPIWSFTTIPSPGYCLDAEYGQWPSSAFTPATCDGTTANVIVTDGYASEYSVVNVTSGQTYKFVSSVPTDLITISADDGATAATYGITPLTWTSNVTGPVRFYTHTDNQCGSSTTDRTRSVLCGSSLGIADTIIEGFSMYPNPVTNILNLKALKPIEAVSVYNMLGQEVMRKASTSTSLEMDMSSLPTGTYILKIQSGYQIGSFSLIKQ